MSGRFNFEKLAKYPHMKPEDILVWEMFIQTNPGYFESVDYDFAVGEGADFLPTGNETPEARENKLYQRKIDVVGYKNGEIYITEVKPKADMGALGQAQTYFELYKKQNPTEKTIIPAVICNTIGNDMLDIFAKLGIKILIANEEAR